MPSEGGYIITVFSGPFWVRLIIAAVFGFLAWSESQQGPKRLTEAQRETFMRWGDCEKDLWAGGAEGGRNYGALSRLARAALDLPEVVAISLSRALVSRTV